MVIGLNPKIIDAFNGIQSSAVKERIAISCPQIVSVPIIDYNNKDVDKDTRKYSAIKSFVQLFVGTFVGMFSRGVGQKIGEHLADTNKVEPISKDLAEKIKTDPAVKKHFVSSTGKTFAVVTTILSIVFLEIPFIDKGIKLAMDKFYPEKKNKKSGGK